MKIKIETPVFPTEDGTKIKHALESVFPGVVFKLNKDLISGESENISSLEYVKTRIEEKKIKNTVSYLLTQYSFDGGTSFELNKQAAMLGKVNFVEEKYPLGNIKVMIETNNLDEVSGYLFSSTT
jgi:predicted RNA binding protein with dsRBD fold (UPF0201 family)